MTFAIHWFRRDLRLADNPALMQAVADGTPFVGFFCFDPAILKRPEIGAPMVDFMVRALASLNAQLEGLGSRLIFRFGEPVEELLRLVGETGAKRVSFNRDYEVYARDRDRRAAERLEAAGVQVFTAHDSVLVHPGRLLTAAEKKPYTVFTPYMRAWRNLVTNEGVAPPQPAPTRHIDPTAPLPTQPKQTIATLASMGVPTLASLGFTLPADFRVEFEATEAAALARARHFVAETAGGYGDRRDFPAIDGTSRLSPHLRHGLVSPRQLIDVVGGVGAFGYKWVQELIWREFYKAILWHFPHVETGCFRPEYDRLQWSTNTEHFAAWCEGRTGYPIVDAAMRQLNRTGWMHNRLRMIVSMFLTKDLHIDWKWGERYFMQRLIDGDVSANNGGWQWSASTGNDAAPYFRIFNPALQSEKFDPRGDFIRHYCPELSGLQGKALHAPGAAKPGELIAGKVRLGADYPRPIVDHSAERDVTLRLYKEARGDAADPAGAAAEAADD